MKLLFFLFLLLIVFAFISKKYANPYKLIFLFGKKGAGKSTLMVRMMLRDLRKGWHVYTDMQDCKVPGVRVFDAEKLGKFIPEPHSSVYLEEVGIRWDNRNYAKFPPEVRDYFKFQRKYKNKVVMNSQAFDIDIKLRNLCDQMSLIVCIGNVLSLERPIRRSVTVTEATSQADSRIADSLKFRSIFSWRFTWLPRYFKYFDSFDAPVRPYLLYKDIGDDLRLTTTKSVKNAFKSLKRHKDNNSMEVDSNVQ